jgi:site-specific recombinase XerD
MNLSMVHMKLAKNGIWQIHYTRTYRRTLATRDKVLATRRFKRLRDIYFENKITTLTGGPARKTLEDFWEEYQDYRRQTAARFTCQTDHQAFRVFLKALGPETNLTRISRQAVEKALAGLAQQVSRTSANTWFRHFKAALSKAVQWGYLKANPCQGIKQLPIQEAFPRFLTEAEFDRLLEAEPDPRFRLFWKFQVYGGARRSESLRVTTQDIKWPLNHINLGHTKNGKPQFIVLNDRIRKILTELGQDVGKLWPWQPDNVTHHFKATVRRAGLNCRLHDLRHTYGSWLVMRGVSLRTVQLLMGHQSIKTTEKYAHVSAAHLEEAAGRL